MSKSKIAITLAEETLERLDELVTQAKFPSRSQAIEQAVEEKLCPLGCVLGSPRNAPSLIVSFERALAEEGLTEDISQWPEY